MSHPANTCVLQCCPAKRGSQGKTDKGKRLQSKGRAPVSRLGHEAGTEPRGKEASSERMPAQHRAWALSLPGSPTCCTRTFRSGLNPL